MPNTSHVEWIERALADSFQSLGVIVPLEQVQGLAQLVMISMSNEGRSFHRPPHVRDMIDPKDAIQTLAALFHDLVYFQVDKGIPAPTEAYLKSILQVEKDSVTLSSDALTVLPGLAVVCDVFQVKPGELLIPTKNMNEFLSAVVAFVSLEGLLPLRSIVQVLVCIEATIPFRPQLKNNDHIQLLAERLTSANAKFNLNLSANEIQSSIERAVRLANLDVKNFASEDPGWFLATTWQLMPERNESLRGSNYTFKDYRSSLEKMSDFVSFLREDLIFKRYNSFPPVKTFEENTRKASRNLQVARTYITAKLVALNLVEALAVLSGGDLPISDFLGPLPKFETLRSRMEQFLPSVNAVSNIDADVLHLLEYGLPLQTSFDLKNSPLAAYVYKHLGDVELNALAKKIGRTPVGAESDPTLLVFFPKKMVAEVASACAKVCGDRSEVLLKLSAIAH